MLLKSLKEKNKATEKGIGGKNMNLKNFLGKLFTKKKNKQIYTNNSVKEICVTDKNKGGGEGGKQKRQSANRVGCFKRKTSS